jgi:prepilin-type N-terminal cleavage/methylation domain-containing protein
MNQHASRRGLSLLEVIVVIAILGLIVALIVPTLRRTRHGPAHIVQCMSNMKQLYSMAVIYSDKVGGGFYPIGPAKDPRAHESLQLLVHYWEHLDPRLFTCPDGEAVEAKKDAVSGKYVLEESNLDFAWIAGPVSNKVTNIVICSDKYVEGHTDAKGVRHRGHRRSFNVLVSDGSISTIDETDPRITGDNLPRGLTR